MNSSRTDTGLGCCCSPLTTEHFTSVTVFTLSPKSPMLRLTTTGDGDSDGSGSVVLTASIIFFSALRSSSHLCNAPSSFCLFSTTVSGEAGTASSPISLATSAGGSRTFSDDFAGLEWRISGGNVGLLGTSLDNLGFRTVQTSSLFFSFAFSGCEFAVAVEMEET